MTVLGVLGVPSSAGARRPGQGRAPHAFRRAGLLDRLLAAGITVRDYGDLPEAVYAPDAGHPRAQNAALVRRVALDVAARIDAMVRDGCAPLVLGGDCTLTLGVVEGMIRSDAALRLVYFDGDADLKTPQDSTSGILDGMVLAHLIGEGLEELSRLGSRYPLLATNQVLLFGFDSEARWFGPVDRRRLEQSGMLAYPANYLRGRAPAIARHVLASFEHPQPRLLVHFDVDVIHFDDFPVADVPHHGALAFIEAFETLRVFVESTNFGGLIITEFNIDRDSDGEQVERFVTALVDMMAATASVRRQR